MFRRLLALAAVAAALPCNLSAQTTANRGEESVAGSEAVVYIRVFGTARAEFAETWRKRLERPGFEFASGSGFVISSAGYVLTNHHVVSGEEVDLAVEGRNVRISITVDRIEVVFGSGQRYDATVLAADESMDLAVLSLAGAANLPYLPFGDSDAIPPSATVTAVGYPFGRRLEIGKSAAADVVPTVSVTSGTVSAVRTDDDEEPRFLQVTNALNPGNSGGPLVDGDGYAVGIVAMRVTKGDRVGFAIPINRAKDFLDQHGLDAALPTRRLSLGPASPMSDKGVRIRMPYGFEDRSQIRTRIDAGVAGWDHLALHIDRVASPWTPGELERALLQGTFVEGLKYERVPTPLRPAGGERTVLRGRARAFDREGRAVIMEYSIAMAGRERVLARYVGTAEAVAFNLGVLRSSLDSIDVSQLLWGAPDPPQLRTPEGRPFVNGAINWLAEPDGPLGCRAPVSSTHVMATSPIEDFTQSTRFAVWDDVAVAAVVAACKPPAREDGSYAFKTTWAGIEYVVEGRFVRYGTSTFQIELVVPADRGASARAWVDEWRAALEAK